MSPSYDNPPNKSELVTCEPTWN